MEEKELDPEYARYERKKAEEIYFKETIFELVAHIRKSPKQRLNNLREYADANNINVNNFSEDIDEKRWALENIMGYRQLNTKSGLLPIKEVYEKAPLHISSTFKRVYNKYN